MQDQDFTKDQNLENNQNQESFNASPEVETVPNFTVNAEEPEQETVVFSRPVEIPVEAQTEAQNVSPDDEQLFGKYEIRNWDFTPRIYKIFAFSAIFNMLFLVGVAQTDVLRTKACDSPLVGGFCQVIDTLYVGGKIIGTNAEWGSKDYEKTKIDDADVVWVDKTSMELPLEYPAGYFQIANPEQFLPEPNGTIPGMTDFPAGINSNPSVVAQNPTITNPTISPNSPNPTNNGILNRKQRLPRANKNAVPLGLPNGINITPTEESKTDTKTPNNSKDETVAENKDKTDSKQPGIKSDSVGKVEVNRKPYDDFGNMVNEKIAKESLDLTKPFEIIMAGTIKKDGKIDTDPKKTLFIKQEGDEKMLEVAREAIEAIGESGILNYLSNIDVEKVTLQLVQTDNEIKVVIVSDQKTPSKAQTKAIALSAIISGAKVLAKTDDEKALLNGSNVTNKDKNFVINFNLSKEIAHPMIKRALEKVEAKRKEAEQTKPNSTAQTTKTQENTGK